ncbi:uncharacterized protein LOC128337515 isoform X2 [Hemicordylus capensis]|uniref:uncharacterized protein LOC128337515 isoform X2 n=1 Tax=Hemicordylus capensis TaxID=884348 RepID=UPI002303C06D|nr:uncharacterized protein LOC128337515 isoform X2 [Hemicordylus capensis]
MILCLAGIMCLSLHTAESQRDTEFSQKLAQSLASLGKGVQISCQLPSGSYTWTVTWYKEGQDKTLHKIEPGSKYSTPERKDAGQVYNLLISDVQRDDSGVYYCAASINEKFRIMSGTKLVVRDTSRSSLSILMPSSLEFAQMNHSIPLLCLFYDANPDWDTVSWNISGEISPGQSDGDTIHGKGASSVWSLKLIPPTRWTQGATYSCSDQENRSISAVVPTSMVCSNTGSCSSVFYYRIPCIVLLLLVPPLTLVFRKHLDSAGLGRSGSDLPSSEIQTEWVNSKH